MEVKVGDSFAAIGAVINDEAVAGFVELALASDPLGGDEEMGEEEMIFSGDGTMAGVMFFWNDKNVDGCLGGEITKGEDVIILVEDIGGELAVDDAFEDGFGHRASYQIVSSRREGLRVRARARIK
jgi:hypothetical protein